MLLKLAQHLCLNVCMHISMFFKLYVYLCMYVYMYVYNSFFAVVSMERCRASWCWKEPVRYPTSSYLTYSWVTPLWGPRLSRGMYVCMYGQKDKKNFIPETQIELSRIGEFLRRHLHTFHEVCSHSAAPYIHTVYTYIHFYCVGPQGNIYMKPTCVGLTSTKKVPLKNGSRLPLKFKLTLQEGAGSHTCMHVIMYFIVTVCMYVCL